PGQRLDPDRARRLAVRYPARRVRHGQRGRTGRHQSGRSLAPALVTVFSVLVTALSVVGAVVGPFVKPDVAWLSGGWGAGAVLMAGLGVADRAGRRWRARVLATGLIGTAEITSVERTATLVAEEPVMRLRLRITVPDRPPYEASVRQLLPHA